MCLEQTINCSLKNSGRIIGNTRRKEFVTRWNVIHHELMSVNETFRELTGVQLASTELSGNHSFSRRQTNDSELKVEKMIQYILKYENPFIVNQSTDPNSTTSSRRPSCLMRPGQLCHSSRNRVTVCITHFARST